MVKPNIAGTGDGNSEYWLTRKLSGKPLVYYDRSRKAFRGGFPSVPQKKALELMVTISATTELVKERCEKLFTQVMKPIVCITRRSRVL
jgi:hypothetical protein